MLVVGKSGVVMDMPEHVATGLISSGVVERVSEEALVAHALMAPPPAVVPTDPPAGGAGETPEGTEGETPAGGESETGDDGVKLPPGNGSREVWVEFGLANGKTEDDLNGLTQTEIRNLFKPAAE